VYGAKDRRWREMTADTTLSSAAGKGRR